MFVDLLIGCALKLFIGGTQYECVMFIWLHTFLHLTLDWSEWWAWGDEQ